MLSAMQKQSKLDAKRRDGESREVEELATQLDTCEKELGKLVVTLIEYREEKESSGREQGEDRAAVDVDKKRVEGNRGCG